ncbi:MAG: hypothetical protein DMG39_21795 [Acidobacteria bacterium]|nr:MAG: hypothetical protein DMG39_21795 [Acidobacteriota bacterium]
MFSKRAASKKNAASGKPSRKKKNMRGRTALVEVRPFELRGLGPRSGGQAGISRDSQRPKVLPPKVSKSCWDSG